MRRRMLVLVCLLPVLMASSCSKTKAPSGPSTSSASASTGSGNCLAGKWTATEGGVAKSFNFNTDGTGVEVQSASDTRNFTWTENGRNIHIVYPAQGDSVKTEFDLDKPNCPGQEYPIYGLVYRK